MLVSHLKRFIYTKTVKTAGTSIEVFFERHCMNPGEWEFSHGRSEYSSNAGIVGCRTGSLLSIQSVMWWNHMPAAAIKALLGQELWNSYFKFCAVRDPFDKLVSAFHYFMPDAEKITKPSNLKQEFEKWLLTSELPLDRNKYTIDGEFCMDAIIRYEHLAEDMRRVCERLAVDFDMAELPTLKRGGRPKRALTDYYTKTSAETVKRLFQFELEHFGYDTPF
jgi:hypothetical protein